MNLTQISGFILHEGASRHSWSGTGLFSLKTFAQGEAYYHVGNGQFRVDTHNYFILNHAQPYTIDIEKYTESFCVFFEPGLVDSVYHTLTRSSEILLADPFIKGNGTPTFFPRTYVYDQVVLHKVASLRENYQRQERGWLDEQLYWLVAHLLHVHHQSCLEIEKIDATRATTRQELYSRLYLAREYINAMYAQPLLLSQIASFVALSPTHLLRCFKQLFSQTPHQYLIEIRLERAKYLLMTTELSITDVGIEVGFESLGSFSWLFRNRFGLSPRAFRQQLW